MGKWIAFFMIAFMGIFTGLLFATGVAQKQLIPMVRQRMGMARVASADSSATASETAVPSAPRPDSVMAKAPEGSSAAATPAPASDSPQKLAVQRAAGQARSPEQQERDGLIAKVYAEMDPLEAAKVLSRLDDPTALAIVTHLKASKAAKVLQAFGPERSTKITLMWANGPMATEGTVTP